jgi:ABC-2 type transport system ATP-binding protein
MLLGLAIIPRPEIIFLDEPTTGLDPQARRNFWRLIEKIKAEKTTVLLTTHYMEEAEILCDQIVIMDKGKILEMDTPENLLARHFNGALVRVPHNGQEQLEFERGAVKGDFWEITTENLDITMKDLLDKGLNLEGLSIKKTKYGRPLSQIDRNIAPDLTGI